MDNTGVCNAISRERNCGIVYCGVVARDARSAASVAEAFGLHPAPDDLREVDAPTASRIAVFVLGCDLAYHDEIVAPVRAADLVAAFIAQFTSGSVRYFTNAYFREDPRSGAIVSMDRWSPLTQGTLDTGIVVVDSNIGGCLWVQDED